MTEEQRQALYRAVAAARTEWEGLVSLHSAAVLGGYGDAIVEQRRVEAVMAAELFLDAQQAALSAWPQT